MWLLEPFAGTFAITRALLGGVDHLDRPRWPAPVGYMGAKNALAAPILRLAGLSPGQGAHRVTLGDGSTIGKILPTLLRDGSVGEVLRGWEGKEPQALWFSLREGGPQTEPALYAASWLWLQARAASGVPVWWSADSLVSMDGHGRGPYPAWQATGKSKLLQCSYKETVNEAGQKGTWKKELGGIKSPSTIADRLDALRAGFDAWKQKGGTLDLWHGGASSLILALLPAIAQARAEGWRVVVYLDPPYQGAAGYERSCSRVEVLDLGRVLDGVGAEVLISEAVGLPLEGWQHQELPSKKPEWVTCNRPVRPSALRGALFSEAV